jgi:hypothetical protein
MMIFFFEPLQDQYEQGTVQKIFPAGTVMECPRTMPVPGPWPVGAAARSWEVTGEDNGLRLTSPTCRCRIPRLRGRSTDGEAKLSQTR